MKRRRQAVDLMRNKPSQLRSEITVGVIFDAATQILDTEGQDKLTTNRVAERAGVSVGSVYYFFPNKLAILEGLALRELERLEYALQDVLVAPSPLGRGENMIRILRAYFSVFGIQLAGRRTLHKFIVDSTLPSVVALARDRLNNALFESVFQENQGSRLLSPAVQRILFRGLLAMLQEAVDQFPTTSFAQVESELQSFIRGMLLAPRAAAIDTREEIGQFTATGA